MARPVLGQKSLTNWSKSATMTHNSERVNTSLVF